MNRPFILIAIIFWLASAALSQTGTAVVSGTVTFADGEPAAGAAVRLSLPGRQAGRIAKADAGGRFRLEGVAEGQYVISAEIDGKAAAQAVAILEGAVSDLELRLSDVPAVREFVDVSVSAGTSQPLSEIAKTVDVIAGDEIDARGDVSLADTLRSVPGFRVQQLGGFGKTANIKTRGLRNQDTAVLIDGMRFRDPTSITGDASAFLSDLDPFGADRIEVLRGSGSSVYGTNAIGGVVDIRTAEPGNGVAGGFESSIGGLGLRSARGRFSAGRESFGLAVSASRTVFTKGIDGEDDASNTGLRARADYAIGGSTFLSGRAYLSRAKVRLNVSPDTVGVQGPDIVNAVSGVNFLPDANDPDSFQWSDFFLGRLSVTHAFSADLFLDASYQGLTTARENENGALGPGFQPFGGTERSVFEGRIDTFETRIRWTPSPRRAFAFGFEFENEGYRNEGDGPQQSDAFFADAGQKSASLYAQHLAGFFDGRFQLGGGARFQFFDVGTPVFSVQNAPYFGLSVDSPPAALTLDGSAAYYIRSNGTKLRAHAGNGYRVPSLYERLGTFYSSFSGQFTALGDPDLKPERSVAFDAGIEQELSRKVRLSATWFYTRLTDTIGFGFPVPDIGSTPRPFGGYLNEKGGIARGVELGVTARPDARSYVFASYTLTNSDQRNPQVSGSGVIETLGVPSDQFTLVAAREVLRGLNVSFDLLVSGSYLAPIFSNQSFTTVLYRFEGNRRGDASASYAIPVFGEKASLKIRASVQNLFGNEYFENGFRTEGRTARAGLGIEF